MWVLRICLMILCHLSWEMYFFCFFIFLQFNIKKYVDWISKDHVFGSGFLIQRQCPQLEPKEVIESNWNEILDSFDDMNLSESLLSGIYAYGSGSLLPSSSKPFFLVSKVMMWSLKPNLGLWKKAPFHDDSVTDWIGFKVYTGLGLSTQ